MKTTTLTCPVCKTWRIDDLGMEDELIRCYELLGRHLSVHPEAVEQVSDEHRKQEQR